MRFVVVMIIAIACGRVGFEARTSDAPLDDDASHPVDDATHDGVGIDAAACAYSAMCATGAFPEETCCTGTTTTCTKTPSTCEGTVTACDVVNNAGCGSGAACCIIAPSTTPACYGPFPPSPC